MRVLKFRQAIYSKDKFDHWHYWGFLPDLSFVGPDSMNGLAHALSNSQQFTGLSDKQGTEIYEGDKVRWKWNEPCEKCEHQPMMEDIVRFGALGATVLGYRLIDPQHGDWLKSAEIIGNIPNKPCYKKKEGK